MTKLHCSSIQTTHRLGTHFSVCALLLACSTFCYSQAQSVAPKIEPTPKAAPAIATKPATATSGATAKAIKSGGLMSAGPDGLIDGPLGSNSSLSMQAVVSISPIGVKFEVTPDINVPLSAYTVSCDTKTTFFNNAYGQPVNDDNLTSNPTLSISSNKVSFTCPYKSSAHALNIAKNVSSHGRISVGHYANSTNYQYKKTAAYDCTRDAKTTVNFTCYAISWSS